MAIIWRIFVLKIIGRQFLESNRVKNGVGYWYGPRKQPRQLASTVVKNQFDRKLSEVER